VPGPLRHDDPDEHVHEELLAAPDVKIEDLFGLEAFKQKSVGIDIGSSTSHLIFSELTLRREGFSSRFIVTDREVLFQSPILLTPYVSGTLIDAAALQAFIEATYASAGVKPEDVDSGAILITGEALKKENAQPIVELFSHQAGKFVTAAAGHNHEALLAAYGSGAVGLSLANGWRMLNVDVGGGTTKFALIDRGEVIETAAISVGARLIAFDESGRLARVEEPANVILGNEDDLSPGKSVTEATKQVLADRMADCLFDIIAGRSASALTEALRITAPLSAYGGLESVDRIMFSGGVSEYVYGRDEVAYGDLGPLLGKGIRQRLEDLGAAKVVANSPSGIRATVIGAGEYTIQASGNTSYLSNRDLLPVYALQVVKAEKSPPDRLDAAISRALRKFDLVTYRDGLALALSLDDNLNYRYLRATAESIARVIGGAEEAVAALFLVLDKDVAKALGTILREEIHLPQEIIALDGIDVGDLDYIDIGRPMGATEVLPVTVKSLIFPHRVEG
jgi:ethanolamine utilization protein EutA (predicted chaperonin)